MIKDIMYTVYIYTYTCIYTECTLRLGATAMLMTFRALEMN